MQAPLLSVRGMKKRFLGVPALIDGSLELDRGDIHALCGGNGAGKSTLLNILMGFIQPDEGEIFIDGTPVRFANAREALGVVSRKGISLRGQSNNCRPAKYTGKTHRPGLEDRTWIETS